MPLDKPSVRLYTILNLRMKGGETNMNNKNLVNFIREHGVKATDCTYKIAVLDEYSKEGKDYQEIVYIEPTLQAARDFLGY